MRNAFKDFANIRAHIVYEVVNLVNYQAKTAIVITLSLLSVGAFVTSAMAPGVSAFDNIEDIDDINHFKIEGNVINELEQLLSTNGYELVSMLEKEDLRFGNEVKLQIKEKLPYHTKWTALDSMFITEEKTLSEGKNGYNIFEITIKSNGDIVSLGDKALVENLEPIDKVVGYGTKDTIEVDEEVRKIKEVIIVEATAYTEMYPCTGKTPDDPYYGITSTGVPVKKGHIAVDPDVIPYFSEVVLVGLDDIGNEYSGKYLATDTGGAIKEKRIDVYIDNYPEVYRFGRRDMKVIVLEE